MFSDDLLVVDAGTAPTQTYSTKIISTGEVTSFPAYRWRNVRCLEALTESGHSVTNSTIRIWPSKSTVACVKAGVLHQQAALVKSVAEK